MKPSWILSTAVCLAMAPIAVSQFETTLQRLDRENSARQWANARAEMRRQIDAFNVEIADARAKFWATYPDKPGAKEAQKRFFDLLYDKDEFYVTSALSNRMSTGGDPGDSLDNGIRSTAQPEFDDFIAAARPGIAMMSGDIMKMMRSVWAAIDLHPDEFRAYRLERDFWEFDQVHRIPAIWDSPEKYPVYLYVRYFHLPIAAAEKSTAQMIELLGKDVVTSAARKVMAAPKTDKGNMVVTAARPIKHGPGGSEVEDYSVPEPANPVGAYASPLITFNRLIAQDDDRRYLLRLLTNQARLDSTTIDRVNQWTFAGAAYARLVAAFGEKDVLEAAHAVRTAPKSYSGGGVMNPDAIGSPRGEPFSAVDDILARKNPRGYLRSAVAFAYSLDSSSSIDAAYRKLVADGGEEAFLSAARRRIKDRPNVASANELRSIQALVGAAPEVEKPPEEKVDFPDYVMWKKFPPGTRITHVERKWMASRPRPGRFNSDNPTVMVAYPPEAIVSYQLKSIDDKKASLWLTQSAAGVYGDMHPARDSELSYPAKYNKSAADSSTRQARDPHNGPTPISTLVWNAVRTADPVESGDEIVEVKGHRIATHWESAKYTGPDFNNEVGVTLVVKVWTSDAIPRGLVRRTEDKRVQHIPGQLEPARYIVETYLDAFEGFTPPPAGPGPVMTAYVPPPVSPTNAGGPTAPPPAAASSSVPNRVAPATPRAPASPPAGTTSVPVKSRHGQPAPTAIDMSRMPPEMAQQVQASQRFTAAMTRATRARSNLLRWQQAKGTSASIPPDIAAARDNIPSQLQAATMAMGSHAPAQVDQTMQTLDASSALIENFLSR